MFYIDPESKVRALIYYPLANGRNFDEIKRLLIAMQTADKHKVATPAPSHFSGLLLFLTDRPARGIKKTLVRPAELDRLIGG